MWFAKSSPYSNLNSSMPLCSTDSAVTKPRRCASLRMWAPNSLIDQDGGSLFRHAFGQRLPETLKDELLAVNDLLALRCGQRQLEAEKAVKIGMPMVEWQQIQCFVGTGVHH